MPNDSPILQPPPRVRMRGVGKRAIRDRRAMVLAGVDAISLDLAAGEVVALLGPGGATVLTLLAGFVQPDSGEIRLDGRVVAQTPPDRRGIGMLFPVPALFPHLDVAGNLGFALRDLAADGRADRVAAVLREFGMGGMGAMPVADLSPAQAQLVALARAVAAKPGVLLLDAPFAGLDTAARARLLDAVRRQAAAGLAVLLATVDAGEALMVADRIGVLVDGRLRQLGSGQAVYDAPCSLAVSRMLGPVNALAGTVEAIEDDMAMVRLRGGALVEALAMEVAQGVACVVAVRPERIAVVAGAAADLGEGAADSVVLEVRELGGHARLRLRLGADEIEVWRPAGVPLLGLVPGAPAAVAWQAYQARAFPG